jgi:NADPH:quinone reductase-like Zn-dependent oxidoreductase
VLAQLKTLGADAIIPLTQSPQELFAAFERQFAEGVDIVLDYLWGPSAEALLTSIGKAAKVAVPIRFVQIGSSGGADIKMPAGVLRSSALELTGSGLGSIRLETLVKAIAGVMEAVSPGKLHIETEAVPLADVEKTWSRDSGGRRIVLLVSQA